jgi:alpha-ribazole phosphatase
MKLLLVSHAETDWNVQSRLQGHTDVPINDRGRRQATLLRGRLAHEPIEAIIASDLARARQTAEIIAEPHGLSVQTDARLREMCFGDWEGFTYDEIDAKYPAELARWQQAAGDPGPPGGERLSDLAARLRDFLDEVTTRPESVILLTAHRGSLRALLCLLLGVSVEGHWDYRLQIASLSIVEWNEGKGVLQEFNQVTEE